MEIEYKWDLGGAGGPAALDASEIVSPFIVGSRSLRMRATYYDTADGLVRELHGGLRVRRENDVSVCCLKLSRESDRGLAKREEYEVEAGDIREGLRRLPDAGAPRDICERLLEQGVAATCETEFDRRAFAVSCDAAAAVLPEGVESFRAELAVDAGVLRREGREREFHEMEFEFKGGSEGTFHAMAKRIQEAGHLTPQPLSKLARAMAV